MSVNSVHSQDMVRGKCLRAICSTCAMASPELTPGAALPLMAAAGYMLYRVTMTGPLMSRSRATASSGTMLPCWLRTFNCPTCSATRRNSPSA